MYMIINSFGIGVVDIQEFNNSFDELQKELDGALRSADPSISFLLKSQNLLITNLMSTTSDLLRQVEKLPFLSSGAPHAGHVFGSFELSQNPAKRNSGVLRMRGFCLVPPFPETLSAVSRVSVNPFNPEGIESMPGAELVIDKATA